MFLMNNKKNVFVENHGLLSGNLYYTIPNKPVIKTELIPNANGRGLYHGTAWRSECRTIA